jgi:predicted  nucleic acid-binding Zn-ribbon protein
VWREFYEYARRLFTLKDQTDKNTEEIKELRQELKQLSEVVREVVYEIRRMKDNEAHEREKLALRLENMLLRSERGLPPPDSN